MVAVSMTLATFNQNQGTIKGKGPSPAYLLHLPSKLVNKVNITLHSPVTDGESLKCLVGFVNMLLV